MNQARLQSILTIVLISLIVTALALAGVFVYRTFSIPTWHQSQPIGYNMYSPDVVDDSTIRYYTGNTFATLNPRTGERKPLTTLYTLPELSDIHWLKNGVVFLSNTAEDYTDLGKKVDEIQGDDDEVPQQRLQPTYWYLSFADNSLTTLLTPAYSLPETTTLTTKEGDFLFKTDDTHFARLSADGTLTYDVFTTIGDTRPVYATTTELYYVETDLKTNATSLYKVAAGADKAGELLYENIYTAGKGTITSTIASQDGNLFYYEFATSDDTHAIKRLDVSHKKVSTLMSSFQGTFTVSGREIILSSLLGGATELTLIPRSGDIHTVRFASTDNRLALQPDARSLDDTLLYTTSDGTMTIIRPTNAPQTYTARNEALEKKITATDQYTLYRDIDDTCNTSYSLSMSQGYYVPIVESFVSDLSHKGISPYEIKLSLSPGMRVTTAPVDQSVQQPVDINLYH